MFTCWLFSYKSQTPGGLVNISVSDSQVKCCINKVLLCCDVLQLSRRAMQRLIQRLLRKLTILGQYEESLVTSSTLVTPLSAVSAPAPASSTAGDKSSALKAKQHVRREECILSVCDDPFILAQQLTHIEMVSEKNIRAPLPCTCLLQTDTKTRECIMGWHVTVNLKYTILQRQL